MSRPAQYVVRIKRSAEKELDRLPRIISDRAEKAILALESNSRPRGSKQLRGTTGYRIRVGDYRILYSIDDVNRLIEIQAIGHRKEVYRDL